MVELPGLVDLALPGGLPRFTPACHLLSGCTVQPGWAQVSPSFCPNSQEHGDAPKNPGLSQTKGISFSLSDSATKGKEWAGDITSVVAVFRLLKGLLFSAVEENQRCDWCLQDLGLRRSRTLEGLSYFSQLRTHSFSAGCGWQGAQPSPQSS